MKSIVFNSGGFGDLLLCFKALFAIKMLYKDYKLILFIPANNPHQDFFREVKFIDELLLFKDEEDFYKTVKSLNPDIFISTHRNSKFFKEIKKLKLKKVIVHPHFISLISSAFITPFPYFRAKKHMGELVLKLAKSIDKKHYEKNEKSLNFSLIKEYLPYDDEQSAEFFASLKPFKKIIAVNAFANNSEGNGTNFYHNYWYFLARELAQDYKDFCFVLLNFKANCLQYNFAEQENLKLFVNEKGIASLASFIKRCDYLISIDTGTVHLSDILQVPSFIFIHSTAAYRYSNSSYGGGGFVWKICS